MTDSLLLRISPELMERIAAHVEQTAKRRPGYSRSDFVREAITQALDEHGES